MSPRRDPDHLSIVIHELRNPLVGIDAAARVLANELGTHPASGRASAIASEARHLLDLLEGLADAEAAAAGRLRSVPRPLDLSALVRETVEAMRAAAHPVVVRGADVAVVARADARRIRQVLGNLLANAAQYSSPGSRIEVTLGIDPVPRSSERPRRSDSRAGRRMATVEVRDHGPGIPPPERRRLFRKFARLSTADGVRGSGLGLYICRAIVADHGGELRAHHPPDGGVAFSFSIPLARIATTRKKGLRPGRKR